MHELIDRLAATPKILANLVAEATDERLDAVVGNGWSARTTLAFFRDDESLATRCALERMLAEYHPALSFPNSVDWERRRNRSRDRKEQLLGDFALQRQASLAILRGLRPEDWERRGSAEDLGDFSIAEFVADWVKYDHDHIVELEKAIGETFAQVMERRAHPA